MVEILYTKKIVNILKQKFYNSKEMNILWWKRRGNTKKKFIKNVKDKVEWNNR